MVRVMPPCPAHIWEFGGLYTLSKLKGAPFKDLLPNSDLNYGSIIDVDLSEYQAVMLRNLTGRTRTAK